MDFPANRFRQAGASPDQIAELAADFEQLPEPAQQSYVDRVAGLASGDLLEMLAATEAHDEALKEEEISDDNDVDDDVDAEGEGETGPEPTEQASAITFSDGSTL